MEIGVLDIQGSVEEHMASLNRLDIFPVLVKDSRDLHLLDGLIIPGGESTTISLLMGEGWAKRLRSLPVYGTCAGMILLAKLGLMDVEIDRNAYGGQMHSFETKISIPVLGKKKFEAIFIRAPRVKKIGGEVEILAEYESAPVMIRQGKCLASSFHPELTEDTRVHEYFLKMCNDYRRAS